MMFLLPSGGIVDKRFGIMTAPGHKSIPAGIIAGLPWAADNEAFTRGFDPERYFPWLATLRPYRATCLFVTVPDVVGDAIQTLDNWRHWVRHFEGWPVAFVGQDGQEDLALPVDYDALFIGGSTEWKLSQGAESVIRRAQAASKHIHIGRVNWQKRYNHFRLMSGSESFTCDGTRPRFDGVDNAMAAWSTYQRQPPLVTV